MNRTMKGIYKSKPEPGAEYRTGLPIPSVGENDVLVKVKATAICGTDLHILHWNDYAAQRVPLPMVFGHEFAGEIVEKGANVTEYEIGDRIAGETHIPCNQCYQCKTNNRHICNSMKIIGVHVPGAFAEFVSIPKDCVYKLPDNISYEQGAMLEPMGVAVHGISAGEVPGKNVLVYGCGPIGLMAVGAAKANRAKQVFAADIIDEKLNLAKTMGADKIINTRNSDIFSSVMEETDGVGVDVAIDYTGNEQAILSGFSVLRKSGRFVLAGLPGSKIAFDFNENIVYKEATLIGITGRRMYETWDECIRILSAGNFNLQSVVGGIFPLEEYEKAFRALEEGRPGKIIMIP